MTAGSAAKRRRSTWTTWTRSLLCWQPTASPSTSASAPSWCPSSQARGFGPHHQQVRHHPPTRTVNHRVPTPSGHEAATLQPGHGQLLPSLHTRYRSSPGAAHRHPPPPSKEVKRHWNGQQPSTTRCSAANRYSPRRCRWHTPHQMRPSPWPGTHPTPTSEAHSNNRSRGPGNRWVSFLASYSLQNRNAQRLTRNSSPPSPQYDISGTSWRDAISSCGQTTDLWSQHSHAFQSHGQLGSSSTWLPTQNLPRILGTFLGRRT
jgi:hypothetical protein